MRKCVSEAHHILVSPAEGPEHLFSIPYFILLPPTIKALAQPSDTYIIAATPKSLIYYEEDKRMK